MLDLAWGTICGLYALHYMARIDRPVTVAEIARYAGFSGDFLSKIMQRLRREKLLTSKRGLGYSLARPARSISVLEVVRALEGPILPSHLCLMKNEDCTFRASCVLSGLCREISGSVLTALGDVDLARLPVGVDGLPVCMTGRSGHPKEE